MANNEMNGISVSISGVMKSGIKASGENGENNGGNQ
jgi:hypothetical protein